MGLLIAKMLTPVETNTIPVDYEDVEFLLNKTVGSKIVFPDPSRLEIKIIELNNFQFIELYYINDVKLKVLIEGDAIHFKLIELNDKYTDTQKTLYTLNDSIKSLKITRVSFESDGNDTPSFHYS